MNENRSRIGESHHVTRLLGALVTAAALAAGVSPAQSAPAPVKIGIIGTGHMGGALATRWAKAGMQLLISSRHPKELEALAKSLGPNVKVGTPREAAAFGSVVLISVPYAATPQIGRDFAKELAGKVVLDTGNPEERRDGKMAIAAKAKGSGLASAEFLPGTRLVRAFNCIPAGMVATGATRNGQRIAIPIAGNDRAAIRTAEELVRAAGFDPVLVGPLKTSKLFDLGGPLARGMHTGPELRKMVADMHIGESD